MTTAVHYPSLDPREPTWRERLRPLALAVVASLSVLAVTVAFVSLFASVQAGNKAAKASAASADNANRLASLAQTQADSNTRQLKFTQDLLCGGFVSIAAAPPGTVNTPLGASIRAWASSGAVLLKCPPLKTPTSG